MQAMPEVLAALVEAWRAPQLRPAAEAALAAVAASAPSAARQARARPRRLVSLQLSAGARPVDRIAAQVREAARAAAVAGALAARITCAMLRDAPALAALVARGPPAGRAWLAAALAAEPDAAAAFHEVSALGHGRGGRAWRARCLAASRPCWAGRPTHARAQALLRSATDGGAAGLAELGALMAGGLAVPPERSAAWLRLLAAAGDRTAFRDPGHSAARAPRCRAPGALSVRAGPQARRIGWPRPASWRCSPRAPTAATCAAPPPLCCAPSRVRERSGWACINLPASRAVDPEQPRRGRPCKAPRSNRVPAALQQVGAQHRVS